MKLYAVKTKKVEKGDDLTEIILSSLQEQKLTLENNDILAVASKVFSHAEGRIVKLSKVKPSEKAEKIACKYSLSPEFAELILQESERIYGGVEKAVLTLKNYMLIPNAGIDNKNAPKGFAVLWPSDPKVSVQKVREKIKQKTGKNVAVLMVDSGLIPLRIGTVGLALAVAGFKPVRDTRGIKDLYGKPLIITRHAVADDLACAAHLLIGEAAEQTPIVLIRDAPVDYDDNVYGAQDVMMPFNECLFANVLHTWKNQKKARHGKQKV
ncbi:MAG: coenzyme F420-0:L-glutamate ligase [Candidatus Bathyarchaeia archaeon]